MDMRSERSFPAAVLSTVRYPLILVDREGGIEAVSHAAADLLTVSPEASRGRSVSEVAGSHGLLLHDAVASVVASGASLPIRPGEFHPEPLTEPDLSLSTYPARATP